MRRPADKTTPMRTGVPLVKPNALNTKGIWYKLATSTWLIRLSISAVTIRKQWIERFHLDISTNQNRIKVHRRNLSVYPERKAWECVTSSSDRSRGRLWQGHPHLGTFSDWMLFLSSHCHPWDPDWTAPCSLQLAFAKEMIKSKGIVLWVIKKTDRNIL